MTYEHPHFEVEGVYHLYNRGVAKQPLFDDEIDYRLLLESFAFYLDESPATSLKTARKLSGFKQLMAHPSPQPLVEILAYCLMPNHFHVVVRQVAEGGVSTFMRRALNSYTRSYNTRHHRVGTMFQGSFKAVHITSDEQFLHVTRYVHLNPFVARLSSTPEYAWSSYGDYLSSTHKRLVNPSLALQLAGSTERYREFTQDYADYARSIAEYKKLLLDEME